MSASYVPYFTQVQYPGVTWTFATSNISPGGDTVIHVQNWDDPQAGFIAGDDDDGGYPASMVVVPPAASTRVLVIVVRAYSSFSAGTCTVTATPSSGQPFSFTTSFGGVVTNVGDLATSSHVTTVERQDGTGDSVLLAVRGWDAEHAVGFDDDDGVGYMSWLHLPEDCASCYLITGTYSNVGTVPLNLVWDDDADSSDWDGDMLGYTLESSVLNTDPFISDSDEDGLTDGAELLGMEVNGVPVKLATWGADPVQKDIFYEFDWIKCNSANQSLCPQGTESGKMGAGKLADDQFYSEVVLPFKTDMTGLRVHMDVGRATTNPSYWFDWGNWGGAERYDSDIGNMCGVQGSSSWRAYLFHHGLSFPPEVTPSQPGGPFGNSCFGPGPFLRHGVNQSRVISHESGHGLGLGHGGRPHVGHMNFKPNYVSVMNYTYEYTVAGFSHGDFPMEGRVLNPTAVKENPGLGAGAASITLPFYWPSPISVLQKLRDDWCPVTAYSSGNCVNLSTGAVDWNRDGVYEAQGTTVQAAVTSFGNRSAMHTEFFSAPTGGHGLLKDPAMTWVSAGGSVGNQLWIFGRDENNQLLWARTPATTLNAGCGGPFSSFDEGMLDCAGMGDPGLGYNPGYTTLVPGPKVLDFAPGAAEYNAKILVVYQPQAPSTLKATLVNINSSNGTVSYETEMTPLESTGGVTATGDVTALSTAAGQVIVWFPTGSGANARLRQIRYQNGSWTSQGDQVFNTGESIVPMYGIGATRGYQDGTGPYTYAAIPVYPNGLVEFARKGALVTSSWTRVTFGCTSGAFGCENVGSSWVASSWAGTGGACPATSTDRPCTAANPDGTQPTASARPGLAYQKRGGQPSNGVGRFYMAINQGALCAGPFGVPDGDPVGCSSRLIMTEGNLVSGTPTTGRLTWITPAQWLAGNWGVGGISLIDDLTRDTNLRATFTNPGAGSDAGWSVFAPLADEIINTNMSDLDDRAYLTGALRAALCLDGGSWPTSSSGGGSCAPLPPGLP